MRAGPVVLGRSRRSCSTRSRRSPAPERYSFSLRATTCASYRRTRPPSVPIHGTQVASSICQAHSPKCLRHSRSSAGIQLLRRKPAESQLELLGCRSGHVRHTIHRSRAPCSSFLQGVVVRVTHLPPLMPSRLPRKLSVSVPVSPHWAGWPQRVRDPQSDRRGIVALSIGGAGRIVAHTGIAANGGCGDASNQDWSPCRRRARRPCVRWPRSPSRRRSVIAR